MSVFEKELIVLGVVPTIELATGDQLFAVTFGEYLNKAQVAPRLTQEQQHASGDRVTANWLMVFVKTDKLIPYIVGSKWKLSVSENGTLSLVESK